MDSMVVSISSALDPLSALSLLEPEKVIAAFTSDERSAVTEEGKAMCIEEREEKDRALPTNSMHAPLQPL